MQIKFLFTLPKLNIMFLEHKASWPLGMKNSSADIRQPDDPPIESKIVKNTLQMMYENNCMREILIWCFQYDSCTACKAYKGVFNYSSWSSSMVSSSSWSLLLRWHHVMASSFAWQTVIIAMLGGLGVMPPRWLQRTQEITIRHEQGALVTSETKWWTDG